MPRLLPCPMLGQPGTEMQRAAISPMEVCGPEASVREEESEETVITAESQFVGTAQYVGADADGGTEHAVVVPRDGARAEQKDDIEETDIEETGTDRGREAGAGADNKEEGVLSHARSHARVHGPTRGPAQALDSGQDHPQDLGQGPALPQDPTARARIHLVRHDIVTAAEVTRHVRELRAHGVTLVKGLQRRNPLCT
mmetsp:Transcript_3270/g.10009  ORF Transcript_3270/g.10009 Transcript_3270/m.10009 type:complete len:198 (+) Transcript_3270:1828-2421(+)